VRSETVSEPSFPVTKLSRVVDVPSDGRGGRGEIEARNFILTFLSREINTNPVV
jgi:hypothetical protein